jgi:hypothetical protein
MRILSRILRSSPERRAVSQQRDSIRRHHAASIGLETLDRRELLSSIAGVTLQFGNIAITAPKASGNTAEVSIDPSNHNVKVSLNGQSEEFSPTLVYNVTYIGGKSGGDTFSNDTNLVCLAYGYGGNNHFTGGASYNFVYFQGNSNTFTGVAGSVSDVFENGGKNDVIHDPGSIYVYS